ncbi:hypothetical protein CcrJ4_gp083 [Caulobacter phage J4]|nr:hypothetical protein CcrJ4_gp083 [Caulobacter phage J4]UTU09387.1 hypothetical protein CcrBL47_gp101 [Caulobacter phage BL47]UTU09947.1 hypothetical protein CcrRB23_gp085 [Caulobacter phage RB23]
MTSPTLSLTVSGARSAGKTVLIRKIAQFLREQGYTVDTERLPRGTDYAFDGVKADGRAVTLFEGGL